MAESLPKLTYTEKLILDTMYKYWKKGERKSPKEIADIINSQEPTVKTHRTALYKAFDIVGLDSEKEEQLMLVYDQILNEQKAAEAPKEEPVKELPPPQNDIVKPEEPKDRKPPYWLVILVGVVMIGVLIYLVSQVGGQVKTVLSTDTPSPIVIDQKFTDPIDPRINITGNYILMNGSLASSDGSPVVIKIGDESWKNYELDVSMPELGACSPVIAIRKKGFNWLEITYVRAGRMGWFRVDNGVAAQLNGDEHLVFQPVVFQLVANGNNFNWVGNAEFTLTGFESGSIEITLSCGRIDHIKVTELP